MVASPVKVPQCRSSHVGSECASVLLSFSYVLRRCAVLSRQVDVIEVPSDCFAVLCSIHSSASTMSALCVLH